MEEGSKLEALRATQPIPIAQLHPEIADQSSQVIEGTITITWPYSILKKSIAFIVAERDFRLRRNKGQIRIEFQGPAGKALADAHIGGGDEVRLSLDGAAWLPFDETQTRVPGEVQDWQLKFVHRLLLQVERGDSETTETLEVNETANGDTTEPPTETEPSEPGLQSTLDTHETPAIEQLEPATPGLTPPLSSRPAKRLASDTFDAGEYASPAFLKRARVSYGSLFEDGFDADEGRRGPSKKPSRFSLGGRPWKYNSRSPSPEPQKTAASEDGADEEVDTARDQEPAIVVTPARPTMVDEGCQTQGLDFDPVMSVQVSAEPRQSSPPLVSSPTAAYSNNPRTRVSGVSRGPAQPLDQNEILRNTDASTDRSTTHLRNLPAQLDSGFEFGAPNHIRDNFYGVPAEGFPGGSLLDRLDHAPIGGLHGPPLGYAGPLDHHIPGETMDIDPSLEYHAPPALHDAPFPLISQDISHQGHPFFDVPQPTAPAAREGWMSVNAANIHVPASASNATQVIASSSPNREHSVSVENSAGDEGRDAPLSEYPDKADREDVDELHDMSSGTSTSEDGEGDFRDGGEVAGEDYDLRNYDSAQQDDDEGQDVESATYESDAGEPAIEFSGRIGDAPEAESEDAEDDADASESEQLQGSDGEVDDERNIYASDDYEEGEGEGYDDDEPQEGEIDEEDEVEEEDEEDGEEYDHEEEDDAEEENEGPAPMRRPPAPAQPVFISLLSDSEDDEGEDEAAEEADRSSPGAPHQLDGAHNDRPKDDEHRGSDDADADREETNDASPAMTDAPVTAERDDIEMEDEHELGKESLQETEDDVESPKSPIGSPKRGELHGVVEEARKETLPQTLPEPSPPSIEVQVPKLGSPSVQPQERAGEPGSPSESAKAPEMDHMELDAPESVDAGNKRLQADENHKVDQIDEPKPTVQKSTSIAPVPSKSEDEAAATTEPAAQNDQDPSPPASLPAQEPPDVPKDGQLETADETSQPTAQEAEEPTDAENPTQIEEPDTASPAKSTNANVSQAPPTDDTEMEDAMLSQPDEEPIQHEQSRDGSADLVDTGPAEDEESTQVKEKSSSPRPNSSLQDISEEGVEDLSSKSSKPKEQEAKATESPVKQLPTPQATQFKEVDEAMAAKKDDTLQDEEGSVGPDDQIMAEYLERSTLPESPKGDEKREESTIEAKQPIVEAEQPREEEVPIAAQSRRKSRPSALTSTTRADPSIALAKASPVTPTSTRSRKASKQGSNSPSTVMRVTRSKPETLDPSVSLARASNTSMRETRNMAHAANRSKTPDLSAEDLKSPSITDSVRSARSAASDGDAPLLKLQLMRELRNKLPDCLALKSLRAALGRITDIVAVATMSPPQPHRPKHGPRDYMLEVILTDPSVAPTGVGVAHIFRPHQASLPVIHTGDVVLLRRFSVVSMKGRGFGVRAGDASSWAVFEKGDEEMLPQIKGPPLEVAREEVDYAEGLRGWWSALDEKALAKVEKATQKSSQAAKEDAK
ncbi:hypothetical protein HJFPF1_11237 [Paramyrothecium foliicola]|nr:hypothetical protein HJFPF1_11237 [Paramyrothecium foliicola]